MSLKPLNDDQQALLNEFKASNLSLLEFAESKGKSSHSIYYLIRKERRLKSECMSFETREQNNFVYVPIRTTETNNVKAVTDKISFKLNGMTFQIDKESLKLFLEVLKYD